MGNITEELTMNLSDYLSGLEGRLDPLSKSYLALWELGAVSNSEPQSPWLTAQEIKAVALAFGPWPLKGEALALAELEAGLAVLPQVRLDLAELAALKAEALAELPVTLVSNEELTLRAAWAAQDKAEAAKLKALASEALALALKLAESCGYALVTGPELGDRDTDNGFDLGPLADSHSSEELASEELESPFETGLDSVVTRDSDMSRLEPGLADQWLKAQGLTWES